MSLRHPSTATRRLLQLASLGLAGLIAGLLTGCTSSATGQLLQPHNDTDWQTSSTYASATAGLSTRAALHAAQVRPCYGANCEFRPVASHTHPSARRSM